MKKIFGTRKDRGLKRVGKIVRKINALEEAMQALDDAALAAKTGEFRQRLAEGATLDDILPEAFAVSPYPAPAAEAVSISNPVRPSS
mgnify:CR=1 FL=1